MFWPRNRYCAKSLVGFVVLTVIRLTRRLAIAEFPERGVRVCATSGFHEILLGT